MVVNIITLNLYVDDYWTRKIWTRLSIDNSENETGYISFNEMQDYWVNSMKKEWANIFLKTTILEKMLNDWNIKFDEQIWIKLLELIIFHAKNNTIFIKQWIDFDKAISIISKNTSF